MASSKTKETATAKLQDLKAGTPIIISVGGVDTKAKLTSVTPAGRFQCRIKGAFAWCEPTQFVRVDEEAAVVNTPIMVAGEPAPVMRVVRDEPAPAAEALAATLGVADSEAPAFAEAVEAAVAEVPASPYKVSEFGAKILNALADLEEARGEEPVTAAGLAEHLNESPKKVAAAFVALNKEELITQSGEKGARLIQLSLAGWDYINATAPAPAPAAVPAEVGEALPEVVFEFTRHNVEALVSILAASADAPVDVLDIFQANAINQIADNRPGIVGRVPSGNADAFFAAYLTPEGVEKATEMAKEFDIQLPAPAVAEPVAAPKKAKGKPGRKPGQTAEAAAEKTVNQYRPRLRAEASKRVPGEPSKGGRPAVGSSTLR